jgi:hypothetical protein
MCVFFSLRDGEKQVKIIIGDEGNKEFVCGK